MTRSDCSRIFFYLADQQIQSTFPKVLAKREVSFECRSRYTVWCNLHAIVSHVDGKNYCLDERSTSTGKIGKSTDRSTLFAERFRDLIEIFRFNSHWRSSNPNEHAAQKGCGK